MLSLDKKFQDKPELHKVLVNGEVSVNKLARVASISTQENQSFLAEQVKVLPQKAVETFVRDIKAHSQSSCVVRAHKLNEQLPILQGATTEEIPAEELELSQNVKEKLHELKQKGIDINLLILNAIQKREQEIAEEKEKLANAQNSETQSRHIPSAIEKIMNMENGDKCAVPNCQKQAEQIHHTIPFALLKNHNPYFLKPLCREHHKIAHGIALSYSKHVRRG